MAVRRLLLKTLEDLSKYDFEKFKSELVDAEEFESIPRSHLEDADPIATVTKMIETYSEEMVVNNAVKVLREMGNNNAAEKLKNRYAARGNSAAPSTSTSAAAPPAAPVAPPAAPASIMAQQGAIVFAPNVTGSTTGTWNVNFK